MFRQEYVHGRLYYNLQSVLDTLMYSSVYLSIASGAMMYISCILQGITFTPILFAIGFSITFSIYNLNRKTDEQEDIINHATRYAFTKKYEHSLFLLSVAGYAGALALAAWFGWGALLVTAFPLLCGIAYSMPFLPAGFRYRRLKEIPLGKNLTVTCAWVFTHALLPVVLVGSMISPMTWATGLFFFALVFVNTVLFDMRDVEGDAEAGVKTVPVLLGIGRTKLLLVAIDIVMGAVVLAISVPLVPWWQSGVLTLGMIYGLGYITSFQRIDLGNLLCDLVADGQFISIGIALYLAGRLV